MIYLWYPIALVGLVAAFWGVWTVVTEEEPRKWIPMTQDQEAAQKLYRRQDRAKIAAMRAMRDIDRQIWFNVRLKEAQHIQHIRTFRKMWDETKHVEARNG